MDGVETVLHLAGGAKGDDAGDREPGAGRGRGPGCGTWCTSRSSARPASRLRLTAEAKLGAEQAVADSGLPWTTLRAAQFHDLVLTMVEQMAKLPVVPVPGGLARRSRSTPRDVAARLVELTLGEPAGLVPDLAGPR